MSTLPAALPPPQAGQPCSCGSGKTYDQCCGPLLAGTRKPGSAEELMRSRFTAHVARDYAYLHRTHLPTWKQPFPGESDPWTQQWTRLVIHSHEPGANPDTAYVDFSAFFADQAGEHALMEKSEFKRVEGQWLYAKTMRLGPAPIKAAPKVGRNDPCPCGSGKKYKQCCLK